MTGGVMQSHSGYKCDLFLHNLQFILLEPKNFTIGSGLSHFSGSVAAFSLTSLTETDQTPKKKSLNSDILRAWVICLIVSTNFSNLSTDRVCHIIQSLMFLWQISKLRRFYESKIKMTEDLWMSDQMKNKSSYPPKDWKKKMQPWYAQGGALGDTAHF